MATCTCCYGDQAISALFNRLVRMFVVDDVVQHHTTITVGCSVDVLTCAQAGNDDGHLVFHAHRHVVLQPVVGLVDDLIDGKRCCRVVRVGQVVGGQRLGDLDQPLFKLLGRPGIERGHGADHASDALGNDQLGVTDNEQGRADDGQWQILEGTGQFGHEFGFQKALEVQKRALAQ